MTRTLNQAPATLPAKRRTKIARRASELATLKDLRQAVERTQEELAAMRWLTASLAGDDFFVPIGLRS